MTRREGDQGYVKATLYRPGISGGLPSIVPLCGRDK